MTTPTSMGNHGGTVTSCSPYAYPGFAEICILLRTWSAVARGTYELAFLIKKRRRKEAAIAQVLRLRATSHLTRYQVVLRSLARILWVSGIVVRVVWVPSALQPGDPMSRVTSVFGGSQARAGARGMHCWIIWARLG